MPTINILPKHIAELIAAGEVVERPASVVKEIMENSIDAGADKITLEIQRGGITYIRITDNGCGIDRNNVRKAFVSHATSKIATADDLNAICTLGFRGEALASIAAVSRVEMMTKSEYEEIGTRYCIEGGEESLIDDAGCPKGTTLIIRDIFYNTPARMKFLKKDVSEGNAVAAVVDRVALSHPEVSVRFIRDGKDALFTTGDGKLENAICKVLGKDFADTLIPCEYELDGVRINGFISKPYNARPNRTMQYFFLNERFIKTRTGLVALEEAYKNQIMVGKFPACVLKIKIAPGAVDVNVHPAKTEVRFANEKLIFNAVYYAAKSALQEGDTRVRADFSQKANRQFMPKPVSGQQLKIYEQQLENAAKSDFWQKVSSQEIKKEVKKEPCQTEPVFEQVTVLKDESRFSVENDEPDLLSMKPQTEFSESTAKANKSEAITETIENKAVEEMTAENKVVIAEAVKEIEPYRIIGEAFKTYILVEQGDKVLIVDKHAAHERMLFEKIKSQTDGVETQILLAPITVTLSKEEYSAVLENLDLLDKAGYSISDFGSGIVLVSECPSALADADLSSSVMEIAGYLASNRKNLIPEKLDWMYHSMACRAAIKAGDRNTEEELNAFIEKLLSNPDIRYCPHGRPVLIEMTKRDIEKNFGRI